MTRYIDADHLKKSVEGLQDCYNGFSDTYDKACIIGLIDEEPVADVVEVVRCKDCKHGKPYRTYNNGYNGIGYRCERYDGYFDSDWFCADGRRENASE